jgi:hypothetical protein
VKFLNGATEPDEPKPKTHPKHIKKAWTEQLPAKEKKKLREPTLRERYNDLTMVHSVRYTLSVDKNLKQLKKVDVTPTIKDPSLKSYSYLKKGSS